MTQNITSPVIYRQLRGDVPIDREGRVWILNVLFLYPWEREFWWVFWCSKVDTKEKKEGASGWEMEKKIIMVGMPPFTVAILPEFWQRMADLTEASRFHGAGKRNRRIDGKGFVYIV